VVERTAQGWEVLATLRHDRDEAPIALNCSDATLSVVTTTRIVDLAPAPRVVHFGRKLSRRLVSSTERSGDALYVGTNAGEWGGTLQRIDLSDGEVASLGLGPDPDVPHEHRSLSPITALGPTPWAPRCLTAASTNLQGDIAGYLAKVCGSEFDVWYEPAHPDGFFGLAVYGDALMAVGLRGMYRLTQKTVELQAMPTFQRIGDVEVSFALPHLVLVRRQLAGGEPTFPPVPLLVPR
jgi:hypothetical protein